MVTAVDALLDCTCAVCGKKCRQRRCSKCLKVNYCSVACQRTDYYEGGHKFTCSSAQPSPSVDNYKETMSPQDAWSELQKSLIQMSPREAHQQFQMAQDEIKRLEEEHRAQVVNENELKKSNRHHATNLVEEQKVIDIKQFPEATETVLNHWHEREWIYVVEEMPNICSYQVTLWPKIDGAPLPDPNNLQLFMHHCKQGNTIISLREGDDYLFSATFRGRLEAMPNVTNVVKRQSDCLTLRLKSRDVLDDFSHRSDYSTSLEAINSLSCRYCDQEILSENHGIQNVMPLPKGHWDEVTDYLICYNGQPAVDFSSASTSAQEHLALEDSVVLVLHCNNMGNGICVLAVEGYGGEGGNDNEVDENTDSATFRCPRPWRDSVGGATLCCSQCCATLGFASLTNPETFRLLKHRLSVKNDAEWNRLHTCTSFVAHEIARYAESKAIYTFILSIRSEGTTKKHAKCILLKLLSWDTRQAKSDDSAAVEEVDILLFKPIVRVIYEVVNDRDATLDNDDPTSWTWGGMDLCCLPDAMKVQSNTDVNTFSQPNQPSAASVRLWLSREEWDEVHESLSRSSVCFSKAVNDATILVKLGPQNDKYMAKLGALSL